MSISVHLINLVATVTMSAYKLRKVEVAYELKIRGLDFDGTANELRKRLTKAMSSNTLVNEEIVNSLEFEDEIRECTLIYTDLEELVTQYDGDHNDDEYSRISARLWHLYPRVQRIPTPNPDTVLEDEGELGKKKDELLVKIKALMDSFLVPLKTLRSDQEELGETSTSRDPEVIPDLELNRQQVAPLSVQSTSGVSVKIPNRQDPGGSSSILMKTKAPTENRSFTVHEPKAKAVPVYKWGLRFDGQGGQSVGAFLERVEEIRRARGLSCDDLFKSAVDLFSGQAIVWYRSTQSRVRSWDELCNEMRIVFRSPDYDFRLQQEIFSRVQGEQESIDMFIAAMEGLYSRLSVKIPEFTRLSQILNNLHPTLQDRLALCDIKSIEDLRLMGRKAEAGRFRVTVPRSVNRSGPVLEPDLAYIEPQRKKTPQVSAIRQHSSSDQDKTCWNCQGKGHRFVECKEARKKFCFRCGEPDTIKPNCSKCKPKNL
jgi:hypothetical protein